MKFRNLGRVTLALAVSLVLVGGMSSCHYNYTNSYVIVTGSQYNQIASYRLDNDTGQLWPALNSNNNLSSGGQDPIRAVLLTGGRFVYVLNHGKPTVDSSGNITWTGGNISLFSIGGDGTLAFQQSYPSQGNGSVRLTLSAGGDYLYVLDEYGPTAGAPYVTPGSATTSAAAPCYDASTGMYRPAGDVTVFSIDGATGRLYLVPNQEQQNSSGVDLNYFPVGCNPIDFYNGSGYLYTAEVSHPGYSGQGEDLYALQAGTTGQLLPPQAPQFIPGTQGISVISASASGKYIYVLDAATNTIYPFTPGTNGQLAANYGSTQNYGGSANVGMDALTTDSSTSWLYIANTASPALGQPNSAITGFTITPTSGVLQPVVSGTSGVFPTGSGPACIFEDTSHQYLYTANAGSSTITGFAINPSTGILATLAHGSTFSTVGTPTWCLYSSNVD
jgi:6-phosphogluconolactonase (cycloisomerase 2 family)